MYSDSLFQIIKSMLQRDIARRPRIDQLLQNEPLQKYLREARAVESDHYVQMRCSLRYVLFSFGKSRSILVQSHVYDSQRLYLFRTGCGRCNLKKMRFVGGNPP